LAFDLVTGQHVRTAAFPDEVVTVNSTITYVSVDFVPGGGCDDFFVYISDTLGGGLLIYINIKETATLVLLFCLNSH